MQKRIPIQLADLPEDRTQETSFGGKRIYKPGDGPIENWKNRFTQANYPFTLTVANQSQKVLPANPYRVYVLIQNKNGAADMFINFGMAAGAYNGIIIIPRGNYELIGGEKGGAFVPRDSINVMSATAGIEGVVTEGVYLPERFEE